MNSREFSNKRTGARQRGAAAVEFALIALIFFVLLFGIMEFGRGLFVWNSVQEVTRYVAREAVVCWRDQWSGMIEARGVMGMPSLPAVPESEFATTNITIEALRRADMVVMGHDPDSVSDNLFNCGNSDFDKDGNSTPQNCIGFVRVTVANAYFKPLMTGALLGFTLPASGIQLPPSTVVMPAESLGYSRNGCTVG